MATTTTNANALLVAIILALLMCSPRCIYSAERRLLVNMTLIRNAPALGACKFLLLNLTQLQEYLEKQI